MPIAEPLLWTRAELRAAVLNHLNRTHVGWGMLGLACCLRADVAELGQVLGELEQAGEIHVARNHDQGPLAYYASSKRHAERALGVAMRERARRRSTA